MWIDEKEMQDSVTRQIPECLVAVQNNVVSLTLAELCAPHRANAGKGEPDMYLSLDHVGERRSPKLREFEIRQVGSRREGVLIIGAMALSCR
jgi:hypothetical protein